LSVFSSRALFRADLSEIYVLQNRVDEAEALSGAASERFKFALLESDILTSKKTTLTTLHHHASHRPDAVVKLLPSDIEIWISTIQALNLQSDATSAHILQQMLQLDLISPDDALRMMHYATHLKVAAFARIQKR
jgi:hypothetical protein